MLGTYAFVAFGWVGFTDLRFVASALVPLRSLVSVAVADWGGWVVHVALLPSDYRHGAGVLAKWPAALESKRLLAQIVDGRFQPHQGAD